MNIEAANVEATAEGDWLNIQSDEGIYAFELTEDTATDIIDLLRDWLRERAEQ